MDFSILSFAIYLLVVGNTTYFLGKALYKNGEHFLKSIFLSKPEVVQPVNKLLLAGFYLVNIGFVLLLFSQDAHPESWLSCVEFLAKQVGMIYLVLGAMHSFNILVFMIIEHKLNRTHKQKSYGNSSN